MDMENKKEKIEKKSLETWARKELNSEEVEGFLQYCEDELLLSRSKMMTERRFMGLMASFGY